MTIDKLVITMLGATFGAIVAAFLAVALHLDSIEAVLFSALAAALSAFQPRALGWVEMSDNFKLALLAAVVAVVVGMITVVFHEKVTYCAGLSFYSASLVMQIAAVHIENRRNKGK